MLSYKTLIGILIGIVSTVAGGLLLEIISTPSMPSEKVVIQIIEERFKDVWPCMKYLGTDNQTRQRDYFRITLFDLRSAKDTQNLNDALKYLVENKYIANVEAYNQYMVPVVGFYALQPFVAQDVEGGWGKDCPYPICKRLCSRFAKYHPEIVSLSSKSQGNVEIMFKMIIVGDRSIVPVVSLVEPINVDRTYRAVLKQETDGNRLYIVGGE